MPKHLIVLICAIFIAHEVLGQCSSFINTFPYNENFESGTNGWNSGGVGNDWAWGAPSKAFITNAGGGTNCWVTGGLGVGAYNNGQRSYVTSPCFDFTNVTYPFFSAKIYWESEFSSISYDGTTFQYSINNGASWTNVGSVSNVVNCLNENWFNSSNIQYLNTLANPKEGWSGSQSNSCGSANGSNGWVIAKHCLSNLAGLPNVQFRFAFGAGTSCNNFDGFAFDDVYIGEAPSNNANFSSSCTGNSLEYQFANTSSLCPDTYLWNFGDVSSGANNTSSSANPTHIFSSPGTYSVSLTVSGPCNAPSTIIHTITTINTSVVASNPLCSNSNNGSIQTSVSNSTGLISYTLQPNNINNFSGNFNNLNANTYTVVVVDGANCAYSKTTSLVAPNSIIWNTTNATNVSCNGLQNGQINVAASGGIGAISYKLNPGNISSSNGLFNNLNVGTFTIIATDANNCSISTTLSITQPNAIQFSSFLASNVLCFSQANGSIQAQATGGNAPLNFTLLPNNIVNTSGVFQNLNGGSYTVVVSDANACSISSIASITSPNEIIFSNILNTKTKCNPNNTGTISFDVSGGSGSFSYSISNGSPSSLNPLFTSLSENSYTITATDANGCTNTFISNIESEKAPIFQNIQTEDILCFGESNGSIQVVAIGSAGILNYSLLPANVTNTNGNFQNLVSGNYTLSAVDNNGCISTENVEISSPEIFLIDKIELTSDSCGDDFKPSIKVVTSGGNGNNLYRILPGGITSNTGVFNQLNNGNYTITASDANNCNTSANIVIKERVCCGDIFVPNAFTPNHDGINDELKLINTAGTELDQFFIFNRWGEVVFKGMTYNYGWDGKYKGVEAEIGTYFYQLRYKCPLSNKSYLKAGDFILIR